MSDRSSVASRNIGACDSLLGDAGSLENITTTLLDDGAFCYVQSEHAHYELHRDSTAASNPPLVIVPIAGPGRWVPVSGTTGAQGSQGSRGAQGFQGTAGTGAQGAQGAQAGAGAQGFQGAQGGQGATGSGAQGATGTQGFQGATGAGTQGAQGGAGSQGATGAQGFQGGAGSGAQGAQGATGAQGAQGAQGFQGGGFQGAQGNPGTNGTAGAQGAVGATGAQGFQGASGTGAQGATGGSGAQGAQGFQGTSGSQGAQGFQGGGVSLSHTEQRTAQTASVGPITLLTAPPSDLYAFDVYLECTTAGSAGTVLATVSYTDHNGAATQLTGTLVLTSASAAVAHLSFRVCFWLASGDVTFSTTVAANVGGQYAVTARAARLTSSI